MPGNPYTTLHFRGVDDKGENISLMLTSWQVSQQPLLKEALLALATAPTTA